jgi:flagellar biosynthesis activator protein FlaF
MSLQAYKKAATRVESPRETEYRLFADVTRALIEASRLDRTDIQGRMDALDWNRRMWSTLATDCALPGNELPEALRASIISLSLFVNRHSSAIMREGEDFETLIEINKIIMQGLAPAAAAPSSDAA